MQQTPKTAINSSLLEETVIASRDELAKHALTTEQQKCLSAEANQWLKQGAAQQRQGNTIAALADFQRRSGPFRP